VAPLDADQVVDAPDDGLVGRFVGPEPSRRAADDLASLTST
jgi:hypothetical protein